MKLGYARCSTLDQNLDWQIDALTYYDSKAYSVDEISRYKPPQGES